MSLISTISAASQKGFQAPDVVQGIALKAKIVPSPAETNRLFGFSVSLTKAGDRIAIGGPGGGGMFGYVWVFSRTGNIWSQETVVSRAVVNDSFGQSVSISGDGNYLAVGAPGQGSGTGGVHLYSRSGTTWTYMGVVGGGGLSGTSVSLNEDGTYLIIGEPGNDTGSTNRGRVQIYLRTGGSWALQQTLLPDNIASLQSGTSVSINDLGTKIIVGNNGSVSNFPPYISTRTGTTWSALSIIGTSADLGEQYVSISGDSNYMAATWERVAENLSTRIYNPGNTVQANIAVTGTQIGFVSLDDTGTNLLQGSKWYSRSGTSWTLQNNFFIYDGTLYGCNSVNDNGDYKAFGAPFEIVNSLTDAGAVYIW
jgi:hypothetical protein